MSEKQAVSDETNDVSLEEETPVSDASEETVEDETTGEETGEFDQKRALSKIRKQNQENKALRQQKKQAETTAADWETKATGLESENLRLKVALDLNLPLAIAERLQGGTKEELLEDAEKLLELFESKTPPTNQPKPKLNTGSQQVVADEIGDLDDFAAKLHSR